jgi:exonuclease SbcC
VELERRLQDFEPLSNEDRAAADVAYKAATEQSEEARREQNDLLKAKDWYDKEDQFQTRISEGNSLLSLASQADEAAEQDRAQLSLVQRAFKLRAEMEAEQTASDRAQSADATLVESRLRDEDARQKCEEAESVKTSAALDRDAKRSAYDDIGSELDKAQRLDAVIGEKKSEAEVASVTLSRCMSERDVARSEVDKIARALKQASDTYDSDQRWLDEHRGAELIAQRLDQVTTDLGRYRELADEMDSIERQRKQAEADRLQAASQCAAKEPEIDDLQQRECGLATEIEGTRTTLDTMPRERLETRRGALIELRTALVEAVAAVSNAAAAEAALAGSERERAQQVEIVETATSCVSDADSDLPVAEARVAEARKSFALSESASSEVAGKLRMQLIDGQPCPVCGATEHYLHEVDEHLKARAEKDRRNVENLEQQVQLLNRNRAAAEARIKAAQEALPSIEVRKQQATAQLASAKVAWAGSSSTVREHSATAEIEIELAASVDVLDPTADRAVDAFLKDVNSCIAETDRTLKQATKAAALLAKQTQQHARLRDELDQCRTSLASLRDAEKAGAVLIVRFDDRTAQMKYAVEELLGRLSGVLAPVYADWRKQLPNSKFANVCRALAGEWRERKQSSDTALEEKGHWDAQRQGCDARVVEKERIVAEAQGRRDSLSAALGLVVTERSALIGGRPVGEVRTEYRERLEAAEAHLVQSEKILTDAAHIVAASSQRVATAKIDLAGALKQHQSAKEIRDECLAKAGITLEESLHALGKQEDWLNSEQVRLNGLREAVATAQATLHERVRALVEHRAMNMPVHARENVDSSLDSARERVAAAAQALMTAHALLQRDNEARLRTAEIGKELESRRSAARVWRQLNELIGAADGSKFRRFAQSLTFEYLLELANIHLADLHRRYELQRAPGGELALQVIDHDMADEVRGVHSLSGGERFLVSLALALGLASMSSNRGLKVESLFIDEGFGSLDSSSLAMAISTLERLQATGRRIGVISHVDELKERIAVKIDVSREGNGRSRVSVVGG